MSQEITLDEIQDFKGKYPKQLWILFLVEMWERFTFYGMRALLGLYISHLILSINYKQADTKTVKDVVAKYAKLGEILDESHPKYYIETSTQKCRNDAESFSNKQYGLINAFIYAMAFLGGMFADKLFGFRKSIFWGGTLMSIGTLLMAIPGTITFYSGISVLIVGNGFFKPNISTMVGSLYRDGDARRDTGFSLFYSGINIGAVLSGLTIAYIGTTYSWSLGFLISGICMLLGLGLFIFTQKSLGPIGLPPFKQKLEKKIIGFKAEFIYFGLSLLLVPIFFLLIYFPIDIDLTFLFGLSENGSSFIVQLCDVIMITAGAITLIYLITEILKSTKEEQKKLFVAMILILFSVLFWSFYEQGGGSLNFFANGNVSNHGMNMTQVNNTINGLWVVIFSPIIGILWLWMNKKKKEPNTVVKFGFGFVFLGIGFFLFYLSKFYADANGLTPLWMFCFAYLIITIGELCLSPIGLSMITKLSPKRLFGVMMGTWFLASAFGQYGAGIIGAAMSQPGSGADATNLSKLNAYCSGYELVAYISIGSGILLIMLSPLLRKLMGEVK
jgi:proton-dependent oligopeptide transporter, POT family